MEAIITVAVCSIIGIIISFNIYCLGERRYKQFAVDMFRAILGADLMYILLVLAIGLAPMSMG